MIGRMATILKTPSQFANKSYLDFKQLCRMNLKFIQLMSMWAKVLRQSTNFVGKPIASISCTKWSWK